jgi:hypothetical protein
MTYFIDTEEETTQVQAYDRPTSIGAELAWQRRPTHGDAVDQSWYTIEVPVPIPLNESVAVIQGLDFAPKYGQVWNASDQTVYLWLSARGRTSQVRQKFDLIIAPYGLASFPWPPDSARSKQLGYCILGGATGEIGKVTFVISKVELPLAGDMTSGIATQQIPFTGTIAGGGGDVVLTLVNGSKSMILANDSATGQAGIAYYTTDQLDQVTGDPIFPNPLPTSTGVTDATNVGGPFVVEPGLPVPIDINVRGILVHNADGVNAADYRIWVVN